MNIVKAKTDQMISDFSASLVLSKFNADKRVQVKMPKIVVEELDRLFPEVDRSHLLTQLATNAILQQLRFQDRQILREQISTEQSGLDDMLDYLEERDAKV